MARQRIRSGHAAEGERAGERPLVLADRLLFVGVAVVAAAGVATVVAAALQGWSPVADHAFIELQVRDVAANPPLLGVWSRYGWSHPGPAQFYLLWPAYLVAGRSSVGLIAGTVALHAAALAAGALLARRRSTVAGVTVFVALLVVVLAPGAGIWRDPWNPWVGLVAAGLLSILAWDLAERGRVGAVAALPVASLLVQAHLGNAVVVATVLVAATAMMWWGHRDDDRPVPGRPFAWGAAVAVVMWVPPGVAQVLGRPGRFTELLEAGAGEGARAGGGAAMAAFTGAFSPVPWWADARSAGEASLTLDPTVPVWLLVPVAGLVVAHRHGDRRFVRGITLSLLAAAAAAAGVVATEASADGMVLSHLVVALRPTAAVSVALGAAAMITALAPTAGRRVTEALAVVGIVLAVALGVLQPWSSNPLDRYGELTGALTAAVVAAGLDDVPLVLVEPEGLGGSEGVFLALERAGADIVVDRSDFDLRLGGHRVETEPGERVELIVAGLRREPELVRDGFSVLGRCRHLGPSERRDLLALMAEQADLLERRDELADRSDSAASRRVEADLLASTEAIRALVGDRVEGLVAARAPGGGSLQLPEGPPEDLCGPTGS